QPGRKITNPSIKTAIKRLEAEGKYKMFSKGEICKKMGIKSTSRIRDILDGMAACGELIGATTALAGYSHEIAVYGLPVMVQSSFLHPHPIMINGVQFSLRGDN
ncbi:MAG: hypothetical protein V4490_08560, partial [Pseudomonadota bacterium]